MTHTDEPSQSEKSPAMVRFLLRMSRINYQKIKRESQRMGVSMTSYINVVVDNHINQQKLNG